MVNVISLVELTSGYSNTHWVNLLMKEHYASLADDINRRFFWGEHFNIVEKCQFVDIPQKYGDTLLLMQPDIISKLD